MKPRVKIRQNWYDWDCMIEDGEWCGRFEYEARYSLGDVLHEPPSTRDMSVLAVILVVWVAFWIWVAYQAFGLFNG